MMLLTPGLGVILWQAIIFLTTLCFLSKFAWKPIISSLRKREDQTAHALTQIEKAELLMQKTVLDKKAIIEEAYLERDRILNQAIHMQKEMVAHARQEATKIQQALEKVAQEKIAYEQRIALNAVQAELSNLSIQVAEKLLRRELSQPEAQLELINKIVHAKPAC